MSAAPQFKNTQIDIDDLPQVSALQLLPLESKYKVVRILVWVILTIVLTAAAFIAIAIFKNQDQMTAIWITVIVYAILISFFFALAYFGYFYMAYAVRERDIYFRKGWIFRKTTVVPFDRIQHCEVNHGPIDRYFGLASLNIFTAGGSSSDLSIPGLSEQRAHRLKDYITKKTALDEEE